MHIGYMRVSKSDGSQLVDLQKDALIQAGVQGNLILSRIKSFPFFAFLLGTLALRIFSVGLPLAWLFIRDISHLYHRPPLRVLVSRSFGHGLYGIMVADPWQMKANLRHGPA